MTVNLNGGEITIIKTLGLSGSSMSGEVLQRRVGGFESAELLDTLQGLMQIGYISSTHDNLRSVRQMEAAVFKVNPSYIKTLQEAIDPRAQAKGKKKRRQRRS